MDAWDSPYGRGRTDSDDAALLGNYFNRLFRTVLLCAGSVRERARTMSRDCALRHRNTRGYTGILNAAFDIIRYRRVEAILPVRYNLPVRCTFSIV